MKNRATSQRKYRVRLSIGIPCLMLLTAVAYGQVCRVLLLNAMANAPYDVRAALKPLALDLEYLVYGAALVATIFGIILARVITGPVNEMARSLEFLASGRGAPSLRISAGDEIGSLFQAYNRMVNSLERMLPERARAIFHNVASGILTVDARGVLTNINSAADKILELGGVGIDGRRCEEFLGQFGEMDSLVAILRRAWVEGRTAAEERVRIRTVSGTQKTIAVTTVVSGSRDGGGFDVVATMMDLSRIQLIAAKMQHEDKLSTVGRLASGVAHEIRNPLASMRGIAQLLREQATGSDPEAMRYLDVIVREVDRLNVVVEQLLEFARPSSQERHPVPVGDLVQNAVELVRPRMRKIEARFHVALDPLLPPCPVVADKVTQVILNLLMNAADAVPPGGLVRIATDRVTEGARISVYNSGSYIPPHERAHLFEPFYTTKERGTGLGLAVSYQIIAAHGGSLVAESDPEKGTTFHCILPLREAGSANGGDSLEAA